MDGRVSPVYSFCSNSCLFFLLNWGHQGLQQCDWFHGNLPRAAAVARLTAASSRSGDFLVRESASRDGFLVVSVNRKGAVRHFLINGAPGAWWVSDERGAGAFPSVQDLITHYVALGPELGLGTPALADVSLLDGTLLGGGGPGGFAGGARAAPPSCPPSAAAPNEYWQF